MVPNRSISRIHETCARLLSLMIAHIDANALRGELDQGSRLQVVDVRTPTEFAEGHIPGALNLPLEELETRLADLTSRDPIVLVCYSGARAEIACENLKPHRSDVRIVDGGTEAWIRAGLPVVGNSGAKLPLMRQVQLVVGPVILVGSSLAILINPLWAALPLLFGCGLTLAGATGWCGLGLLLSKMPWNRTRAVSAGSCCAPEGVGK